MSHTNYEYTSKAAIQYSNRARSQSVHFPNKNIQRKQEKQLKWRTARQQQQLRGKCHEFLILKDLCNRNAEAELTASWQQQQHEEMVIRANTNRLATQLFCFLQNL